MEEISGNTCDINDEREDQNNKKMIFHIEYYSRTSCYIDCDQSQIEGWYIKWNTLHIILKDGTEKEFELDEPECDYKYPNYITITNPSTEYEEEFDYITV